MSSSSSSSTSSAPPASSPRRLRLRFIVDGHTVATPNALVVPRGLSQRGAGSTASRKRSASSLQTASGKQAQAGSATLSSSSSSSTARSVLPSASSSSSSAAVLPSASQSDFARAVPAHPDVVALRVEDAGPVIAAAAAGGGGASSLPNVSAGSCDAALGSAAASSLFSSSVSSLTVVPAASVAPSLSSTLLASMLNISQPDTAGVSSASAYQFPYSGPMLSRARVKPAFPVIVPASATWFDMESIHSRERRAFPDWLLAGGGDAAAGGGRRGGRSQSQQSAAWYRDIRNAIVTAYRSNPRVFLTVTACRRQIAADAGAVTRIHSFLQQSGLINYHVDPGSVPLMGYSGSRDRVAFPIFAHNVSVNASNAANAAAAGDSALSQLFAFSSTPAAAASAASAASSSDTAATAAQTSATTESTTAASSSSSPSSAGGAGLPPSFRSVLVGPLLSQDTAVKDPRYELLHRPHLLCSQCGVAVDSSSGSSGLRFVSRHDPSLLLCPDCFGRGNFPPLAVADDFLRVTASTGRYSHPSVASPPTVTANAGQLTAAASSSSSSQPTAGAASGQSSSLSSSSSSGSGDWTPEETLRLLDALARYGDDDWDAVQEAVGGSRTVEDCCQHFLSLPIEDPFLDQYPRVTSSASPTTEAQQPDSAPAPVPFADAGNPILAQVAFLASTVSPAVAAAAAQAAILAFSKQQQPASDSNGQETQQPATDGNAAASSSHSSWSEQLLSQPQQTGTAASPAVSAAAAAASEPLPLSSIPVVSAVCLSAAAVKARELCLDEERKLLRCVAQIVQVQMRKVEIKLNHLTELDAFLAAKQQDVRAFHQRALQNQQAQLMQSRQQQAQSDAVNSISSSGTAPAATETAQVAAAVTS